VCRFDNCGVPIGDAKALLGCKCGKHEVDRHCLYGKPGPGGNESNCDLRSYPRSAQSRGLRVKFLKYLNRERKVGSQKDMPGDRTLFGLLLRRADGVQENICANEGRHGNRVLPVLPVEKLGIVQSERKIPPGDVPIS
jgi:hypothetical protein